MARSWSAQRIPVREQSRFQPGWLANTMTKENRVTQDRYRKLFPSNKDPLKDVSKEALKQALEIRKFEIELYWKRATYFWTFIGAAFVAFGVFYNTTPANETAAENRENALVFISCIGFVFSLAWHYVNKGSKFWQENWENHVSLLEDTHIGPLYKSRAERPAVTAPSCRDRIEHLLVDPAPFSVSKINQLVSTFIAIIWAFILLDSTLLVAYLANLIAKGDSQYTFAPKKAIPTALALLTWLFFRWIGKSHQGDHHPAVYLRDVVISKPAIPSQEKNKAVRLENHTIKIPAERPKESIAPPKKNRASRRREKGRT
ncbi:RipA family octameric membrane protein [Corallococcus exiguus]|uniref:RipA family octameric membrane protein n=1 Tax=Corallococcus exiguus TaxID=83462 RepID=UPI0014946C54|nr:hypothetical protein [Corallococcus exiguus]NPD27277.1 hypothetical protein [Corallococcus exiguus]